MAVLIQLEAI